MQNTIEGFRPGAEQGQAERGKRREGLFSKIGGKVMDFLRRELAIPSSGRRASESLRAHAAQLQEQYPHRNPNAVRHIQTTADRVDLGHGNIPSHEARFSRGAPMSGEQQIPMVVEGQVVDVRDHLPSPRTHTEGVSEDIALPKEQHMAGESVKSPSEGHGFNRMEGSLPEPNESEIIGTEAWYKAKASKQPQVHNPNDVSMGTEAWFKEKEKTSTPNPHEVSIGMEHPANWLKGEEAKAVVQEQQARIQEQSARARAEAEDNAGDELWQARKARQQRLLRMEQSVRPGEYSPEVIGAEPTDKDSHNQEAA